MKRPKDCPVCSAPMEPAFAMRILGRHDVDYFSCGACGFLQTESPYWLADAYSDAIAAADTGLVFRNLYIARRLATFLLLAFDRRARFVDVAGGTGLLVRLMRDMGFDFFWSDRYCANVHARGFEYAPSLGPCAAVTAFEALEHLEDPVGFVRDALRESGAAAFVCSTELFEGDPPRPGDWWYYCPETGQHISFFQRRTLERIAERLDLRLHSSGSFHLLTREDIAGWRFRLAMSRFGWILGLPLRALLASRTARDHRRLLAKAR